MLIGLQRFTLYQPARVCYILRWLRSAVSRLLQYVVQFSQQLQLRIGYSPEVDSFPLTKQQRQERKEGFIKDIDKKAVRQLAARYNNGELCILDKTSTGSYNVCFFVYFPTSDKRWVVRLPIAPLISHMHIKCQSELTTMRHIQNNTSIPTPRILASGESTMLLRGSAEPLPFLILECVPGRPLTTDQIENCTDSQRSNFFSEFSAILLQLRNLRFSQTGCLMPSHGHCEPTIAPPILLVENDLEINTNLSRNTPPSLDSITTTLDYLYKVLLDFIRLPEAKALPDTLKREIFATQDLAKQIHKAFDKAGMNDTFQLTHMDLRPENILVDEHLRIRAVLDWEWATILPRQLCTPPLWFTGHDPEWRSLQPKIQAAISTLQPESNPLNDWASHELALPIAQALRHPSSLLEIYATSIFPVLYDKPFIEIAYERFQHSRELKVLHERIALSERYTDYLDRLDLLCVDEDEEEIRAGLRRADDFIEKLQSDGFY